MCLAVFFRNFSKSCSNSVFQQWDFILLRITGFFERKTSENYFFTSFILKENHHWLHKLFWMYRYFVDPHIKEKNISKRRFGLWNRRQVVNLAVRLNSVFRLCGLISELFSSAELQATGKGKVTFSFINPRSSSLIFPQSFKTLAFSEAASLVSEVFIITIQIFEDI